MFLFFRWRMPSLVVAVLTVLGGAVLLQSRDREPEWVTADVDFVLPADKIEVYRTKALAGDNDAARALADHFEVTGNREEARRWHVLAASRGDCLSMLSLMYNKGLSERQRAFWKGKAKEISCDPSYYFRNHAK